MDNSSGVPTAVYVFLALYLAFAILIVWADVRIIQRAGYSGWWILIGLVPIVGIVMYFVFAFKEWPIQREVALLRAQVAGGYGNPPAGYGYGYPQTGGYGYPPSGYGYPPPGNAPGGPQPGSPTNW